MDPRNSLASQTSLNGKCQLHTIGENVNDFCTAEIRMEVPKNLKVDRPSNAAVLFLGIHLRNVSLHL